MSQVGPVPIARVLGWRPTDDRTHVVIGFTQGPPNSEFAIALTHEVLLNTIVNMVGALDAFEEQRVAPEAKFSIETNWYEVGQVEGSNQFVVAFRTKGGGFLRFAMDRSMVERLSETFRAALGDEHAAERDCSR